MMKDRIKEFINIGMPEGTSVSEMPAHLLDLLRSALLGSCRGGDKKMISKQQQPEQEKQELADDEQEKQEAYAHGCCCRRRMKEFPSFQCLFPRQLFVRLSSKKESSSSSQGINNKWQTFRHIRELKAAGIHFQPSATSFLTDISFESHVFYGYLKLPFLLIDDSTKPMFLNLVAYEMCPDAPEDYAVTSFLCFLDDLIDHPDDVKELRSKKILYNSLGIDEEVARVFNEITDGFVYLDVYRDVKDDIQKHYDKRLNTWIAQALHNHFNSP